MSEQLKVTPASDWEAPLITGTLVKLPSGKVARLRRTLSLMRLLEAGEIPNPLLPYIQQMSKVAEITEADTASLDLAELDPNALTELAKLVVEETPNIWMEPIVMRVPPGEDPDTWRPEIAGAVSEMVIDFKDKMAAYSFAQGGPAEGLERFPEATPHVAATQNVGAVPHPAKRAAVDT